MPALTPVVFHILLALSGAPRHGYGILKDILDQTDGRVRLGAGTLYGSLQRLMAQEWVEEARTPAGADTRRKYYKLTRHGRAALEDEAARLRDLVDLMQTRRVPAARA